MKYVFDSSSIYYLIGSRKASFLSQNYTCDLARYELGNILLKENRINKKISKPEQIILLGAIKQALNLMFFIDIRNNENGILQIANQYSLTFYDAAYVYVAKKIGATLVTEDKILSHKISRYLKTISCTDLSWFGSHKNLGPFTREDESDEKLR
ncbi:MAG: type II toxin-antitoxin system VapC family toxin [Candidatus Micrarchaeota archaeon]|nr:type II toxin-antitoxin system VapC family toxin [Candidatus Micrarchaeota archaeon]